jgi:excisionase family DNA binding protein
MHSADNEWLSLSEAARLLGVHPSTVRSWADQGRLSAHRTRGGHRRFKKTEIELCMVSQQNNDQDALAEIMQGALRRTRIHISEGHLEAETWYQKLDQEAREQYRQSGRYLLQGLMMALVSSQKDISSEARSLGYEYASRGKRCGLTCTEATHAFLFFRRVLLDAMFAVYESAAVRSPHAWAEMFRKINTFTDQILTTLLETYESYSRNNNR